MSLDEYNRIVDWWAYRMGEAECLAFEAEVFSDPRLEDALERVEISRFLPESQARH